MDKSVVILILLVGLFLLLITKRSVSHDKGGRRSGKNRRKRFLASRNRLRRSNKDRRVVPDRRKGDSISDRDPKIRDMEFWMPDRKKRRGDT